ncbi:MAG: subclass B3 metallo-beta-lactamase [Hymenobacter sp.]|nr:MAG: subclass B3 metallo-beta-lactamase [Hymenobacter sp.]
MLKPVLKVFLLVISLSACTFLAQAQKVTEPTNTPAEWSKPYPPFRIAGNLYYVGTYDLACYLITTPKGNILINTGLLGSLLMIKANIEALGFKLTNTKILLTMQAHYDHMGAMARVKKLTGAKVMIDAKDAGVMADGGSSDYALGGHGFMYEPVQPDCLLKDKDTISLGGTHIVMLHHPGHTKGSCSFLLDVKDEIRSYRVLLANMPTIVTDSKFSEIPAYPDIAKDYTYTLNAMRKLKFDLWLSAHASQFDLHAKHQVGDKYNPSAFMDQAGYDAETSRLQAELDKKMKDK